MASRVIRDLISLAILITILMPSITPLYATPLTISTDKSQYKPGDKVKIIINGKPTTIYGIEVRDPVNAVVVADQVQTDSNGKATYSFGLSNNAREGTYKIYVSGGGESATKTFKVKKAAAPSPPPAPTKKSSSIKLSLNATVLELCQYLKVSGQLNPKLEGVEILLVYKWPNGSKTYRRVVTSKNGVFEDVFKPEMLGAWFVEAKWYGNNEYRGCSTQKTFWVKQRVEVTLMVSPVKAVLDSAIAIYGRIDPPLENVKIVIEYSLDRVNWIEIGEVYTGANGTFGYTYVVTMLGKISFRAVVPETEILLESISNVVEVTVREMARVEVNVEVEPSEVRPGEEVLIKVFLNTSVTGSARVSAYYGLEEISITELELDEKDYFEVSWTPEKEGVYVIVVEVVPEVGIPAAGFKILTVRRPVYTLSFVVESEDGFAVGGVLVGVYKGGNLIALAVTKADGRASFYLLEDSYRVVFTYMGEVLYETTVDLVEDKEVKAVLPLVRVELYIKDALGSPIAGTSLVVEDQYGNRYSAVTDAEGRVFLLVPKGNIKVMWGGVEKETIAKEAGVIELTVPVIIGLEYAVGLFIAGVIVGFIIAKIIYTKKEKA